MILPVALFLVWLYVKTDVLTAITAMTLLSVAESGVMFLLPGNTGYHAEGVILLAALSAVLAWAIAALLLPDEVENFDDIAPRFQRHITERHRRRVGQRHAGGVLHGTGQGLPSGAGLAA